MVRLQDADIHQGGLRASLSGIFKSGEYSDMTIYCGGRDFKVYRAIDSSRCRFFTAACDGEFQVAAMDIEWLVRTDDLRNQLRKMFC